eukprot:symbB.v1.2.013002.t1/scaffold912.1/size152940/8
MKVTLTQESCDCLGLVSEIDVWSVGPTMVRGAKPKATAGPEKEIEAPKKKRRRFGIRRLISKQPDGKKTKKKPKRSKRRNAGQVVDSGSDVEDSALPIEPNASHFKRTQAGRKCIVRMLQILYNLDASAFPAAPAFDADGVCRLKTESAHGKVWSELRESGPSCIESMPPG